MILRLLTFPVDSFMWVVEQIEERALEELDRQQNLQKKLMSLQIRFDMGDLAEAEFMIQEEALLIAIAAELDQQQSIPEQVSTFTITDL
jgi:Gas vesicle protein G